jgi:TPR repeat protein
VTRTRPLAARPLGDRRSARAALPVALLALAVAGVHPATPALAVDPAVDPALDPALDAKVREVLKAQEGIPAEWVVHDWADASLEPAAALGDPYALFVVGRKYLIDEANSGSEETRRLGLDYLDWSARLGFSPADRFLGSLYLAGTTVARDPARGIGYLERAAERGDAIAQRRLGDLYFEGAEVAPDPSRALLWYGRALANPDPGLPGDRPWEVALRLARLHLDAKAPEADPTRARGILERAAQTYPVGPVLKALADAYALGLGGPREPDRALATYEAAAAGYLDRGITLGVDPPDARREAGDILAAMERVDPGAPASLRLRLRLAGAPDTALSPSPDGAGSLVRTR